MREGFQWASGTKKSLRVRDKLLILIIGTFHRCIYMLKYIKMYTLNISSLLYVSYTLIKSYLKNTQNRLPDSSKKEFGGLTGKQKPRCKSYSGCTGSC